MNRLLLLLGVYIIFSADAVTQEEFRKDIIETLGGDLTITFIGHGTLMFEYQDQVIHLDPWSRLADYSKLPKADLILITHEHGDHLDPEAIKLLKKDQTQLFLTEACEKKIKQGKVLNNGDYFSFGSIPIEAVPAYNIYSRRGNGQPYHPKGRGNGYILTFGNKRVYVAGDTEWIPEMKKFPQVNIAFVPMNLPYTMTPEMAAETARTLKTEIVYPYHFGDTRVETLSELLMGSGIEVRVRPMK